MGLLPYVVIILCAKSTLQMEGRPAKALWSFQTELNVFIIWGTLFTFIHLLGCLLRRIPC